MSGAQHHHGASEGDNRHLQFIQATAKAAYGSANVTAEVRMRQHLHCSSPKGSNPKGADPEGALHAGAHPQAAQQVGAQQLRAQRYASNSSRRFRRGAVMVEYVVIVGVVSLGVATAIAGLGPTLLADYHRSRAILAMPFP